MAAPTKAQIDEALTVIASVYQHEQDARQAYNNAVSSSLNGMPDYATAENALLGIRQAYNTATDTFKRSVAEQEDILADCRKTVARQAGIIQLHLNVQDAQDLAAALRSGLSKARQTS